MKHVPVLHDKNLDATGGVAVFLAANFLYIFPLVQADYFYNDDNWRTFATGENWSEEGRVVIEIFTTLFRLVRRRQICSRCRFSLLW